MPDRRVDYLLIGGGVASASCARTLREEGADGSILLVGREPHPPYERPPLSKDYLRGESGREDAAFLDPDWWEQNDVELLTRTSVMKLDAGERVAKLSNKEEVGFGQALLATGANVRRLRIDGADLDGIHYLRAFANADAIRAETEDAERVVLVGGSYIACEVAASLTAMGKPCAMVMMESVTLERTFGPEVGGFVQRALEERGVEIVASDEVERIDGANGRVAKVVSKGGRELDAGCVVIGCGVAPDTMLARGAGLELGDGGGISCSARLEASVPGVYAAGDVAEYESPLHGGRPLRIEHWEVAVAQGRTAALSMLGREQEHDTVPYFWSDLGDWATLEYVGAGSGDLVVRGSIDDGDFTGFYLDGARVAAAVTLGRSDDLDHARRMIREGTEPHRAALADESTDLAAI